ncbi:FHA domain-containing protein [Amycolatopsis samaneae]|uniref:FHA domain-containing protein n=1 Tax=Amycolatopsis samaneae TaxID=664691 RepID=A0ABW5G771_9PSEU
MPETPQTLRPRGGRLLSASHESLARGITSTPPGAVSALSLTGGVSWGPKEGRRLIFGRNRPEVHVCLGENDLRVSRHHGTLTCESGRWWVSNHGGVPIRLAGSRLLFRDEDQVPLDTGYTPLFVRGSGSREHLLEIYVSGPDGGMPQPQYSRQTCPGEVYPLSPAERLALVALGQRYLLHEARPQPWSWKDTAQLLAEIQPGFGWKSRRVEELVGEVRLRLSRAGVPGLTRDEVPEPLGNALNHNLLTELLMSATLVPRDLDLLDEPE